MWSWRSSDLWLSSLKTRVLPSFLIVTFKNVSSEVNCSYINAQNRSFIFLAVQHFFVSIFVCFFNLLVEWKYSTISRCIISNISHKVCYNVVVLFYHTVLARASSLPYILELITPFCWAVKLLSPESVSCLTFKPFLYSGQRPSTVLFHSKNTVHAVWINSFLK